MWWTLVWILRETSVEQLLALSYEALLGSAGFFDGRVASFEVVGTMARLE